MFAIRAARAYTGRPLSPGSSGAYHGTHDTALAGTPGVPTASRELVVDLPWGDPDGVERALPAASPRSPRSSSSRSRAPAASARPIPRSCGSCAIYADRIGALLIFDEIIAFRVGPNGRQGARRRPTRT